MQFHNKSGFTLIELSIVLVILGLIVGTLAPLFVSLSKRNKLSDGRQIVSTARDEIKGDIIRSRMVPANTNNIGHTVDPWQNNLVYIPAPNLSGQDLCTWLAGGVNQTGLAVCIDGDCTAGKKTNVAFIIASIGANFNRQMQVPVNLDGDGTDNEVRLYSYGTEIDQYTVAPDPNRPTDQFDDIVEYVTADELVQLFNCSISVSNESGQTGCNGGAAVLDGVRLGVLEFNQLMGIGSTVDNCVTIDNSCTVSYNAAQLADTDQDGEVRITSTPPACTLADL